MKRNFNDRFNRTIAFVMAGIMVSGSLQMSGPAAMYTYAEDGVSTSSINTGSTQSTSSDNSLTGSLNSESVGNTGSTENTGTNSNGGNSGNTGTNGNGGNSGNTGTNGNGGNSGDTGINITSGATGTSVKTETTVNTDTTETTETTEATDTTETTNITKTTDTTNTTKTTKNRKAATQDHPEKPDLYKVTYSVDPEDSAKISLSFNDEDCGVPFIIERTADKDKAEWNIVAEDTAEGTADSTSDDNEKQTLILSDDLAVSGQNCTFRVEASKDYIITGVKVNGDNVDLTDTKTTDAYKEDGSSVEGAVISGSYTISGITSDEDIRVETAKTLDPDEEITLKGNADNRYNVTVKGSRKVLGRAKSVKASVIPEDKAQEIADSDDKIPDNSEVVAALDISLADKDGNEIEPSGDVSVTIDKILEDVAAPKEELTLFHVPDDADTEKIDMKTAGDEGADADVKDNGVGFVTGSMSPYIIVAQNSGTSLNTITGSISVDSSDKWIKEDLKDSKSIPISISVTIKDASGKQVGDTITRKPGDAGYSLSTESDYSKLYFKLDSLGLTGIGENYTVSIAVTSYHNGGDYSILKYIYTDYDKDVSLGSGSIDTTTGKLAFPEITGLKSMTHKVYISQTIPADESDVSKNLSYKLTYMNSQYTDYSEKQITLKADTEVSTDYWTIPEGLDIKIEPTSVDQFSNLYDPTTKTVGSYDFNVYFTRNEVAQPTDHTFTVVWSDNNDSESVRPLTTAAPAAHMEYSLDGGTTWKTDDWKTDTGITAPTVGTPKSTSTSNWDYTVSVPDKYKGVDISYRLSYDSDPVSANGTGKTITGYKRSGYSDDDKTLHMNAIGYFNAAICWKDVTAAGARPDISDMLAKYNLYAAEDNSVKIKDSDMSAEWFTDNGDNTWSVKISGLPLFSDDDSPLSYYLTQDTAVKKSSYSNGSYAAPEYDNGTGTYGNVTDKCYEGGKISNVFIEPATVDFYKIWNDIGNTDRPECTLYLWRYTEGVGSYSTGSPAQYIDSTGKFVGPFVSAVVPTSGDSPIKISFPESGNTLPKYDSEGRRYIYYATEKFTDSTPSKYEGYEVKYYSTYSETQKVKPAGDFTPENGTVVNKKIPKTDVKVNKLWTGLTNNADVNGLTLGLGLLRKIENGTCELVTDDEDKPVNMSLSDFTKDDLYKSVTFSGLDKCDENGNVFEYIPYEYIDTDYAFPFSSSETGTVKIGETTYDLSDNTITVNGSEYKTGIDTNKNDGITLDNTPNAKEKFIVKKVWADSYNSNDRPDSVSFHFSRTDSHGVTEDNVIPDGADDSKCTITKDQNATTDDNIWQSDYENKAEVTGNEYSFDRYDGTGHEYSYYVTEDAITNYWHYDPDYTVTTENGIKKTTATITNHRTAPGASDPRIDIVKKWNDCVPNSDRKPVTVFLAKKAEGSGYTAITGKSAVLSVANNWHGYIYYNDETGWDPKTDYIIETQIGDSGDGSSVAIDGSSYKIVDSGVTNSDIKSGFTDGAETYDVVVSKDEKDTSKESCGKNWTVTNTNVSVTGFVVKKTWNDSGTHNRIKLTLKRNGIDYAVFTQPESGTVTKSDFAAAGTGGYLNDDAGVVSSESDDTFVYSFGSELPKYDDKFVTYVYTVDEQLWDSTNLKWTEPVNVSYDASLEDKGFLTSYTPIAGKGEYKNSYAVEMTNTKAETPSSPIFYKRWIDFNNESGTRSDISLKLYREVVKGSNTLYEEVPDVSIPEKSRWVKRTDDSYDDGKGTDLSYDWELLFDPLPRNVDADMITQDSKLNGYLGGSITYFVSENELPNYKTSYYKAIKGDGSWGGDKTGNYNSSCDTKKAETFTAGSDTVSAAPENGLITNRYNDYMTISGIKVWNNLPSGTKTDSSLLPGNDDIVFKLQYRIEGVSETPADYIYNDDITAPVSEGTNDVLAYLKKEGSNYSYSFKEGNGNAESSADLCKLPKYDANGKKYIYSIIETYSTTGSNIDGAVCQNLYADSTTHLITDIRLKNIYNADSYKKSITVHKFWADMPTGNTLYPDVKYKLYRIDPGVEITDVGTASSITDIAPAASTYTDDTDAMNKTVLGTAFSAVSGLDEASTQAVFTGLPYYAPNGKPYTYVVEESAINGYSVTSEKGGSIDGSAASTRFVVVTNGTAALNGTDEEAASYKNTYGPEKITISGTKAWDVRSDTTWNAAGSATASWQPLNSDLTLILKYRVGASGAFSDYDVNKYMISWSDSIFTVKDDTGVSDLGLEKYAPSGAAYEYQIIEDIPENWTHYAAGCKIWKNYTRPVGTLSTGDASKYTKTSVGELKNTFGKTYKITKIWNDNKNFYGTRPESITF